MLILTRKPGQSLTIEPEPSIDPGTPVAQLFAGGSIRVQVFGGHGPSVRLGVEADPGFSILRDELVCMASTLADGARRVLARKIKVLMFQHRHSTQSLAAASGLPPERVLAAERGAGRLRVDDLERLAAALGVKVVELLRPAGQTDVERAVLALIEREEE